jgi:hypothetical protein
VLRGVDAQHWVRERGVLTLEHAVRKLTADQPTCSASTIAVAFFPDAADLVLFDPDTVGTTGVRFVADQPARARLVTDAVGIVASVVNVSSPPATANRPARQDAAIGARGSGAVVSSGGSVGSVAVVVGWSSSPSRRPRALRPAGSSRWSPAAEQLRVRRR